VSVQLVQLRGTGLYLGRGHIVAKVGAALIAGDWNGWSNQARASCAGVQRLRVAMARDHGHDLYVPVEVVGSPSSSSHGPAEACVCFSFTRFLIAVCWLYLGRCSSLRAGAIKKTNGRGHA